ncbi:polarity establishment/cellular polarization [Naganishia albida]|nr:polarity establishment/cellular polarization [Naganishia albida]
MGTETQSTPVALPDPLHIGVVQPASRATLSLHGRQEENGHLLSRGEPRFPENSITVINPLSWQLSATFNPSQTAQDIPKTYDQPKAVISSAFTFLDGSNYAPGLRIPPGWSFSVGFHPIFAPRSEGSTGRDISIRYSLRLQDGADLPWWMVYDGEHLTLSGVTPWIGEGDPIPRQEIYAIRMIASIVSSSYDNDPPETATFAQSFTLVVASHSFECLHRSDVPGILALKLTKGGGRVEQPLTFGAIGGVEGVYLDAQPVQERNIESARVGVEWASLQPATASSPRMLVIPRWRSDYKVLPTTLTNTYGEQLDVLIDLNFQDPIFRYSSQPGWLDNTKLHIGQDFSISLAQNTTRKIEQRGLRQEVLVVEHLPSWMRLSLDPLEVSGSVPGDAANGTLVALVFRYTDPETFAVSKVSWNLTLVAEDKADGGGGDHPFKGEDADGRRGLSRRAVIVLAVLMSLLGVALLVGALFILRRNRKARRVEKRKWAEVLFRDRGAGSSGSFASQPFVSNSIQLQRPQAAYHQKLAPHRPASPSKLKTLLESAITPTKKVRKLGLDFKDRSKRYTRSFMSYPIDYLDPTTPPSSCMPIQPPPPPPSPSPLRPVSLVASLAPFAAIDPPMSGLPSTNFTSDTFLHGRLGSASSASWEDAPSRHDGSSGHPTTETDNWMHGDLVVMNPEDDGQTLQAYNGRPPNLFYAELCHRNSSILRPRDAMPFPASVNSFVDSVRTEERVADAPSVHGG